MEKTGQKDFDIQYEYMPTDQSKIRLRRGFEIIFKQIEKLDPDKNKYDDRYK